MKFLVARFPYGGSEYHACANWLVQNVAWLKNQGHEVDHLEINDTPITMSRNRALKMARDQGCDYCIMLDSDMVPDLPYPGARPFLPTAVRFAQSHTGPCIIGAPYCGPPPHENVYVFRWSKLQSDHPNVDLKLEQYGREEAAIRGGFEEVAALPTGLILIDVRVTRILKPLWFDYEWNDPEGSEKASTEDVFFTRNASLAGIRNYVLWDAWAGHVKQKVVGKPQLLTVDQVRAEFRDALRRPPENERLVYLGLERHEPLAEEASCAILGCAS